MSWNKYLISEDATYNFQSNLEKRLVLTKEWKCFHCFHVETFTLLIAWWHLVIHLFCFVLYISAFYFAEGYCEAVSIYSRSDISLDSVEYHIPKNGSTVWKFMCIISFISTVLLINGVSKKITFLILPFLFIQLFDLLFDLTILMVYVLLSSNMSEFFNQISNRQFQNFLANFTFHQKKIFASCYIVLSFLAKAYLMSVVFSCYRLLLLSNKDEKERNFSSYTHENHNNQEINSNRLRISSTR